MASVNGISADTISTAQHGAHDISTRSVPGAPTFSIPVRNAPVLPAATSSSAPAAPATRMRGHELHEQALKLHAYRLQLIASNIANADTPNYKAVDIDFREALRTMQSQPQPAHGHPLSPALRVGYTQSPQPSVDGNTVDMEQERAKFAETMLRYEFSLNKVSGHYKMMAELLNNLKD